ncbi:hypothetical protein HZ326_10462 [Fusarium oxysporum f. sp. albedinis]|nr:hypothetical protein HZ326_10462 [Fusarium oxysporum f. sp. albedinis]
MRVHHTIAAQKTFLSFVYCQLVYFGTYQQLTAFSGVVGFESPIRIIISHCFFTEDALWSSANGLLHLRCRKEKRIMHLQQNWMAPWLELD